MITLPTTESELYAALKNFRLGFDEVASSESTSSAVKTESDEETDELETKRPPSVIWGRALVTAEPFHVDDVSNYSYSLAVRK